MIYHVVYILAVVSLIVSLSSPCKAQVTETRCVNNTTVVYEQMAAIEADNICPPVVLINRFRTLVDQLVRRCEDETPPQLAERIETARKLLYDGGIEAGYLQIMEGISRLAQEGVRDLERQGRAKTTVNCSFVIALYVTQRIGD